MSPIYEDLPNKVIIDSSDTNKVVIEDQVNKVVVSTFGPQGATGPQGPIGPIGPSGKYTISEAAPTENLEAGDLWFRSSTAQLYFYYDGYWIETSTSYLGPTGATGPAGPGVPTGGTAGQFLTKINGTNYNTQWTSPPTAIRYSPVFSATGLTFTGSGSTYPTYNSYYVKFGQMVSFWIAVDLSTVTNFGTGQYKLELPVAPLAGTSNHFHAWLWINPAENPDTAGHHILVADHPANSSTLDMHYIKSGPANQAVIEQQFKQGSPDTLTTVSRFYINGTYISAS